ncbi:MAG: hypothetical protein WAV32_05105 [Halobacteriota archaeon]
MEGGTNVPKMEQGVLGDGGASFNFLILPKKSLLLIADHQNLGMRKGREVEKA